MSSIIFIVLLFREVRPAEVQKQAIGQTLIVIMMRNVMVAENIMKIAIVTIAEMIIATIIDNREVGYGNRT